MSSGSLPARETPDASGESGRDPLEVSGAPDRDEERPDLEVELEPLDLDRLGPRELFADEERLRAFDLHPPHVVETSNRTVVPVSTTMGSESGAVRTSGPGRSCMAATGVSVAASTSRILSITVRRWSGDP